MILINCFTVFAQKSVMNYVPGEIYVKVKAKYAQKINPKNKDLNIGTELAFLKNSALTNNLNIKKALKPFLNTKNKDLNNIIRLNFDQNANLDQIIKAFKLEPYFEFVEAIPLRTTIAIPNDTSFVKQWSLNKIKAPQAWDINPGGSAVVVAVIDNAIQTTHPDLTANMVAGKDMSDSADTDPNPPNATFAHGTHVAGIVGAVSNNIRGISSAGNNKVKVMPIKATPDNGLANSIYFGYEGIVWAVDHGAKIISMSWGGQGFSNVEKEIIDYAHSQGVVLVAAAGNDNSTTLTYPASYDHVISVASTDTNDVKSSFSTFNELVDISAPGRAILSTLPYDRYGNASGTSMATPLVAAYLGYLWSAFPSLTPAQLEQLMKSSADNIYGVNPTHINRLGAGRINLLNAVACQTEGLSNLSFTYGPSRYFCPGDSITISTANIPGTTYLWSLNAVPLTDVDNSTKINQAGVYNLKVSKNNCVINYKTKPVFIQNLESPSANISATLIEKQYCAGLDTLKATSPSCSFPGNYTSQYNGSTIGYDDFLKSGPDPKVVFENIPGTIDSVEINISWQKLSGGNQNSCGVTSGTGIPYYEEIGFNLKSPAGDIYTLMLEGVYNRGTTNLGIINITFKNSAANIISGGLPISGNFRPNTSFSGLQGDSPNGTWTLLPLDNSPNDPLCVSGFQVKVYTNVNPSISNLSWWDAAIGGTKISSSTNLPLANPSLGLHNYFVQNTCSGLCPSARKKVEYYVKPRPEIIGFPFEDIILTNAQITEISTANNFLITYNGNQVYAQGINANNAAFNYLVSNKPPKHTPVSLCNTSSYVLIAFGCTGQVQWSNGQVNQGIILQNLNANYTATAHCIQALSCPIVAATSFNFTLSSLVTQNLTGWISGNASQTNHANSINSTQIINPISKINYRADKSIVLSPGFKVEQGNVFSAQIGACN